MKLKKIMNYLMWIPFAIAIGSLTLYFKYFFEVKVISTVAVTGLINVAMNRYLKIGLFSLFIGLLLLFVSKLSKLLFEDKYYNETYPWTNLENYNDNKVEEKQIDEIKEIKEIKEDIIINNVNNSSKLSKDLNSNKVLKARFINKNDEKMIEILTDEDEELEVLSLDDVVVMPEVKKQTVIKLDSSKVNIEGYKHCHKCNNLVDKDAVICVNCGVLLNDKIKTKKHLFNPISFAINLIIILFGIIAIIILSNKIVEQKKINEENINSGVIINDQLIEYE